MYNSLSFQAWKHNSSSWCGKLEGHSRTGNLFLCFPNLVPLIQRLDGILHEITYIQLFDHMSHLIILQARHAEDIGATSLAVLATTFFTPNTLGMHNTWKRDLNA